MYEPSEVESELQSYFSFESGRYESLGMKE